MPAIHSWTGPIEKYGGTSGVRSQERWAGRACWLSGWPWEFGSARTLRCITCPWRIARYGSAAIYDRVRNVYGDSGGKWACVLQASMLAYFLRHNPKVGAELLRSAAGATHSGRGAIARCCPTSPGTKKGTFYFFVSIRGELEK